MPIRTRGSLQIQFFESISWGKGVSKRKPQKTKNNPSHPGFNSNCSRTPLALLEERKALTKACTEDQQRNSARGNIKETGD